MLRLAHFLMWAPSLFAILVFSMAMTFLFWLTEAAPLP
jgi:hypothetical protein